MQSNATTVAEYLASLPADRRAAMAAVRKVILANLDRDYQEGMEYGMIGYGVPHRVYPAGYHCNPRHPLPFAGLAAQKNYMSLYLMSVYLDGGDEAWFREAWARTGKKLDLGKCCLRFRKLEDLALEVIGEAIRRVPAKAYIARYEATLRTTSSTAARRAGAKAVSPDPPARKKTAKKTATRAGRTRRGA